MIPFTNRKLIYDGKSQNGGCPLGTWGASDLEGHKGTLWDADSDLYLNLGGGYMVVFHMKRFIKLYTL